jgi:hypothetical protein
METVPVFMSLLAALLALTFLELHVGLPTVTEYQGHPGNSAVVAGFCSWKQITVREIR